MQLAHHGIIGHSPSAARLSFAAGSNGNGRYFRMLADAEEIMLTQGSQLNAGNYVSIRNLPIAYPDAIYNSLAHHKEVIGAYEVTMPHTLAASQARYVTFSQNGFAGAWHDQWWHVTRIVD